MDPITLWMFSNPGTYNSELYYYVATKEPTPTQANRKLGWTTRYQPVVHLRLNGKNPKFLLRWVDIQPLELARLTLTRTTDNNAPVRISDRGLFIFNRQFKSVVCGPWRHHLGLPTSSSHYAFRDRGTYYFHLEVGDTRWLPVIEEIKEAA